MLANCDLTFTAPPRVTSKKGSPECSIPRARATLHEARGTACCRRRQPNHRNREIFPRKCVYAPCHSSHPAEVEQGPNLPQNGRNSPSRGSVELQLCLYFRHCIPFSCLHNALIAFSNCMYLVTSEFILQLMAK